MLNYDTSPILYVYRINIIHHVGLDITSISVENDINSLYLHLILILIRLTIPKSCKLKHEIGI